MKNNIFLWFPFIDNKRMRAVRENSNSKTAQTSFLCKWVCSGKSRRQLVLKTLNLLFFNIKTFGQLSRCLKLENCWGCLVSLGILKENEQTSLYLIALSVQRKYNSKLWSGQRDNCILVWAPKLCAQEKLIQKTSVD